MLHHCYGEVRAISINMIPLPKDITNIIKYYRAQLGIGSITKDILVHPGLNLCCFLDKWSF